MYITRHSFQTFIVLPLPGLSFPHIKPSKLPFTYALTLVYVRHLMQYLPSITSYHPGPATGITTQQGSEQ